MTQEKSLHCSAEAFFVERWRRTMGASLRECANVQMSKCANELRLASRMGSNDGGEVSRPRLRGPYTRYGGDVWNVAFYTALSDALWAQAHGGEVSRPRLRGPYTRYGGDVWNVAFYTALKRCFAGASAWGRSLPTSHCMKIKSDVSNVASIEGANRVEREVGRLRPHALAPSMHC